MADAAQDRQRLAELLVATAGGDRVAFRRLYDLSARSIFGIVAAIMRDHQLAEEVTQEVYVTIWKRAGSFESENSNPKSWMAAIARNRAIDRLRAERTRGFVTYTDDVPDVFDRNRNADLPIQTIAIRRALGNLRPEFRQAILLSYFNGYTNSELATVLDVPVGTAKSWLRRGLAALREALE